MLPLPLPMLSLSRLVLLVTPPCISIADRFTKALERRRCQSSPSMALCVSIDDMLARNAIEIRWRQSVLSRTQGSIVSVPLFNTSWASRPSIPAPPVPWRPSRTITVSWGRARSIRSIVVNGPCLPSTTPRLIDTWGGTTTHVPIITPVPDSPIAPWLGAKSRVERCVMDYARTEPPLIERVLQRISPTHSRVMTRFVAPAANIISLRCGIISWVKTSGAMLRQMARTFTAHTRVLAVVSIHPRTI